MASNLYMRPHQTVVSLAGRKKAAPATRHTSSTRADSKTLLLTAALLYIAYAPLQWPTPVGALRAGPARASDSLSGAASRQPERDLRWPNRQVNVLVDRKSLNESESAVLATVFRQLQHKTCLHVHRLPPDRVNPFMARDLNDTERNFVHIFKSPLASGAALGRHPSMGLSSLGCVGQGRQSLVLTELAFKWPELVLRYHIMRSLGVDKLERPDGHVRRLLNMLPLNQKISSDAEPDSRGQDGPKPALGLFSDLTISNLHEKSPAIERPQFMASASGPARGGPAGQYLSEGDLATVKQLYECADYQNRLSPLILDGDDAEPQTADPRPTTDPPLRPDDKTKSRSADSPVRPANASAPQEVHGDGLESKAAEPAAISEQATKRIVDSLIEPDSDSSKGGPNESVATVAPDLEQDLPINSHRLECKPLESCPLADGDDRPGPAADATSPGGQARPMILKLDDFHAQDPQLKQADQMKLSQLSNDTLETYRLMNNPTNLADFWPQAPMSDPQQQQQQQQQQLQQPSQSAAGSTPWQKPKSEMLISFEQSNNQLRDPVSALASSQVLKLCSCTCQTMTPASGEATQPPSQTTTKPPPAPTMAPTTATPVTAWTPTSPEPTPTTMMPSSPSSVPSRTVTFPTIGPVIPTDPGPNCTDGECITLSPNWPSPFTPNPWTAFPPATLPPSPQPTSKPAPVYPSSETPPTEQPTTSTASPTEPSSAWTATTASFGYTNATAATTYTPASQTPTTSGEQPAQTSSTASSPLLAANACDQVQWVRPNKTVYASARIVWDVDRGNQNYFLCNNQLNGELIPGKTHGFSCKISQEGRAFEAHSFSVLTKPESVNLAWVQKGSSSFGRTNFPVVGGFSKQQDPYIVSRCLVKDENNDIITLIGYINNQGVGWFPFDDIQIECSQYDVLACVN